MQVIHADSNLIPERLIVSRLLEQSRAPLALVATLCHAMDKTLPVHLQPASLVSLGAQLDELVVLLEWMLPHQLGLVVHRHHLAFLQYVQFLVRLVVS